MQRGRSPVSQSRLALGAAVVAAAALAVAGCSSGSSAASTSAGSSGSASAPVGGSASASAADTSFFNGKTLTLIVPSKPGGGYDAWGRLMAIWMGQYLHATIKVTNIGAGNTIVGQNQLAASPGNGLFLGEINLGTDTQLKASNTKGLDFDPATDVEYIGAVAGGVVGIFAQGNTGYKTIDDLKSADKQITVVSQSAGTSALFIRTVLGVYGVNAKFITGYSSTADEAAGFLRGDGAVSAVNLDAVVDALKDGKIVPVAVSNTPASTNTAYAQLKDAPSLNDLLIKNPPASADGKEALTALVGVMDIGQVFAVPKGVPANEVAALTAAMQWAMQQPGLISAAEKQGLDAGFLAPSFVQKTISTTYQDASTLSPYASTSS